MILGTIRDMSTQKKESYFFASFRYQLTSVVLAALMLVSWQVDVGLELLGALKSNNAKNIAELFSQNVALSIKNDSGHYSKFQAEVMLNDFFRSTKTTEVKQVQRTNRSSASFYIVYQMKTSQGAYRVFAKFNQSRGEATIAELRIE